MVDLFLDELTLTEIQVINNEQVLVFKNKEKDESLHIPVADKELLNIFTRVRIRCETLELIEHK